ncbi:hypothetical protein Hanom_Chr12g01148091 [Helianthus anomalus]
MADNVAGEHEQHEHKPSLVEYVKEKIFETFHKEDSSDSDGETKKSSPVSDLKDKVYWLFGRERPVHKVLGGGKAVDIFLWKDKKVSASVLGFATVIWVFFELVEYHLLTLVCHTLILALVVLFLWSNATSFISKSAPKFLEVALPEDIVLGVASAIKTVINTGLAILRNIASGKDLKKFLAVIAGLWVLSILGSWWNFLTLIYTSFVLLHTVPYLYDRYEDKVDAFAEKAEAEIKKQYAVFNVKFQVPVVASVCNMELDLVSLRKMMKAEFRIDIGTWSAPPLEVVKKSVFRALRSLVYSHGVIVINVIPPNVFFSKTLVKQLQDVFHKFYAMDAKNDGNIVLIATVSPIVSNDHDSSSCVRVCFYRVASYNTSPLGLDRLQLC